MKVVFEAIMSHFQSDSILLALLTGGLWFISAPQNDDNASPTVEVPYAVYNPISIINDFTFTEDIDNFIFQFNVYTETYDELETIIAAFVGDSDPANGFHFAELAPTGYEATKLIPVSTAYNFVGETRLWQVTITYSIDLEKTDSIRT